MNRKEALAERCVDKSLEPNQIKNVDFNDLHLIDKNGHWKKATIDDIQSSIKKNGSADIVLRCEMTDRDLGLLSDLEYHEVTGVSDIIVDGSFMAIEAEDKFLCTEDIEHEFFNERNERGIPETASMDFMTWRDAQSWDGNADPKFSDDGYKFSAPDWEDGPIFE